MKKITFVAEFAECGGVETVFMTYIQLLKKNYICQLISTDVMPQNMMNFCKKENIPFFTYKFVKQKHWLKKTIYKIYRFFLIRKALKICRKSDVLIDFKNGCSLKLLQRAKGRLAQRQILWIHGGLSFVQDYMKFDWSCFDKIVVLTDALKNDLIKLHPDLADRFVRIYNPFDIQKITDLNKKDNDLSFPYFVHVSRLSCDKDLKTLIDAYEILWLRTHTKTKLCIVGDGAERCNLQEYAASKQSSQSIIFLLYQENPLPFMREAKAVILSSPAEGLACVLIEGLIATKGVVVASDCPSGPREILLDGKCGCLFPVGDTHALADILQDIDSGNINRDKFSVNILPSLKRFELDNVARDIFKLIEA